MIPSFNTIFILYLVAYYTIYLQSARDSSRHTIPIILFAGTPDNTVNINFKNGSYLFLATEDTAPTLAENIAVQKAAGVDVNTWVMN